MRFPPWCRGRAGWAIQCESRGIRSSLTPRRGTIREVHPQSRIRGCPDIPDDRAACVCRTPLSGQSAGQHSACVDLAQCAGAVITRTEDRLGQPRVLFSAAGQGRTDFGNARRLFLVPTCPSACRGRPNRLQGNAPMNGQASALRQEALVRVVPDQPDVSHRVSRPGEHLHRGTGHQQGIRLRQDHDGRRSSAPSSGATRCSKFRAAGWATGSGHGAC